MLASTLRSQLPRALSLRALVDLSHKVNDQVPEPVAPVVEPQVPCWRLFLNIEMTCVLKDGCTKRGCESKRIAQCKACKRVGYCGVDCQQRLVGSKNLYCLHSRVHRISYSDWHEHRKVCTLKLE
jgi:hypothetical protein